MAYVWAGGEWADFTRVGVAGTYYLQANGGLQDTAYARCNVALSGGFDGTTNALRADFPSPATYVRWNMNTQGSANGSSYAHITLFSATGDVCRLVAAAVVNQLKFQRWDGSAWQDVYTHTYAPDSLRKYMIKAVCEAAGELELWCEGVLLASYAGDLSARGAVTGLRLGTHYNHNSYSSCFSEIIAATHKILYARLKTLAITANGASQGWTSGAFGDIDSFNEAESTFIASNTAGQDDTYVVGDTAADTLHVHAVIVSGWMRRGSTGPQNIDALVRVGGVNYPTSVGALAETFGPKQVLLATDPSTAAAWSKTAVNALEIGARSVG